MSRAILPDALSLDDIAAVGGVSRFHMVRAFAAATGFSVMRYVRARRLTEAARALAGGAPDILTLALEADYGSHEAFTRAFRDHFGVTPELVRASTCLDKLKLQEPIVMDSTALDKLQPPRFETGKPFLVAGIGERCTAAKGRGHSRPVAALSPVGRADSRPDRARWPTASAATATTPEISTTSPASKCPIFPTCRASSPGFASPRRNTRCSAHCEHISTIRRTVNTIWNHWLPSSGLKAADAPSFERYDEKFDSSTGNGGLEIWIPIREYRRAVQPKGRSLKSSTSRRRWH